MTRSQKLLLIALVLVVVVFALLVWHGASQPACADRAALARPECKPGGGMKSLGALTSPFAKGMKLPQPSYPVGPNGNASVALPAASDKMRSLKIKLTQGSGAKLRLENLRPDADADPDGMARQRDLSRNSLPFYDDDHVLQRTITLVVTDEGGQLTMHCTGPSPCVFENE